MLWSRVDLFFVLSGFLICGILLDVVSSQSYFRTFYIRRAYRILPLYFVVLLGACLITWRYHGQPGWAASADELPYYAVFLQNFWMAAHGTFGSTMLVATWSLAVEEQFYLTLPVIVRLVAWRTLAFILIATVAISPLLRILACAYFPNRFIAAHVLMPCRADALALGALAALCVRTPAVWSKLVQHRGYLYAALVIVGFAILAMLRRYSIFTSQFLDLEYSLLATFYCLLLVSALLSRTVASMFSFAWLRYLGSVAYGTYLLHGPIIGKCRDLAVRFYPGHRGPVFMTSSLLGVLVSVGMAGLSWKYFEKPVVRRGHRYTYHPALSASARVA
jgi:peptidoglycan/LPS O-acetylase OafA/YrhL